MSVQIQWEGLDELRTALRNLPEDLATQAAVVVSAVAMQDAQETKIDYPIRQTGTHPGYRRKTTYFPPGNLRKGVTVSDKSTRFTARFVVRSGAPHAWLFEHGTEGRQRRNKQGANRGAMPAAPESEKMIVKAIRSRQRMKAQLIEIVKAAGFEITES
jgi:hypothetical protein